MKKILSHYIVFLVLFITFFYVHQTTNAQGNDKYLALDATSSNTTSSATSSTATNTNSGSSISNGASGAINGGVEAATGTIESSVGSESGTGEESSGGCNINQQITSGKSGTELGREDAKKAVTLVANLLAGAAGAVALAFIVIAGIQLITAGGNQEQAGKAKNALTWAVIGFILIIASYGIITFFIGLIKGGGA